MNWSNIWRLFLKLLARQLETVAAFLQKQAVLTEKASQKTVGDSETSGGPPPHWRNTAGPPEHWLEKVRQGAPQLLEPDVVPLMRANSSHSDKPANYPSDGRTEGRKAPPESIAMEHSKERVQPKKVWIPEQLKVKTAKPWVIGRAIPAKIGAMQSEFPEPNKLENPSSGWLELPTRIWRSITRKPEVIIKQSNRQIQTAQQPIFDTSPRSQRPFDSSTRSASPSVPPVSWSTNRDKLPQAIPTEEPLHTTKQRKIELPDQLPLHATPPVSWSTNRDKLPQAIPTKEEFPPLPLSLNAEQVSKRDEKRSEQLPIYRQEGSYQTRSFNNQQLPLNFLTGSPQTTEFSGDFNARWADLPDAPEQASDEVYLPFLQREWERVRRLEWEQRGDYGTRSFFD
jgi:hypothetical protein